MEVYFRHCFSKVIFLAFILFIPLHAAEKPLVLAVHPYLPTAELQSRFAPLAEYLGEVLETKVEIRIGGDYEEHIDAIGRNSVDIAFLGPAAYVKMVSKYGAKPLLARFELAGKPQLFGVIATRKESTIPNLISLAKERFAFGDAGSTMSHIVPRYMLMQAGIPGGLPEKHHFLGSHKNVALGILVGDFAAGAMKKEVFEEFKPRGLKALKMTPGVPDHLFVTQNNLPEQKINKIRNAMLALKAGDKQDLRILRKMHKKLTALVPAKNSDYDELRKMVEAVDAATRSSN